VNAFPAPSTEDETGRKSHRLRGDDNGPVPRKLRLRLSPHAATALAAVGLALAFTWETDRFGFNARTPLSSSPSEAVDISLRRLARSRVVNRLQRAQCLNGSLVENKSAVDRELARIREHPLYMMIKEKMVDHLESQGFQNVPINQTTDLSERGLSSEAETALYNLMHSLRAYCPVSNERVAVFLRDHEAHFGKSIAAHDGAGGYDMALTLLIQLLFEYPDDLAPVARAVRIYPIAADSSALIVSRHDR
jgi:hypothetical protein